MSLQLSATKQPVFRLPSLIEGNSAPFGDGKERVFRPYQGNECLAYRLRTGIKGELLIVQKSKIEERKQQ